MIPPSTEEFRNWKRTTVHQQREIKALAGTAKEQGAQVQKVSAQLELSKHATQTALTDQ